MSSFRVVIFDKTGSPIFDKTVGELDDCSEHLVNILMAFKPHLKNDPRLIVDLEMGDFAVAMSSCCSTYFATVVSTKEQEKIKQLNRVVSIFLALTYSQHEAAFGHRSSGSFVNIKDTLYSDLDKQISTFYDPEETSYMCFISDEKIICSKGIIPYRGSDYLDVSTDLMELSDICLYEPFAAFKERPNVVVFPYLDNLQIGFINFNEIDEEQEMINVYKTRLSTSKFTTTQLFMVDDDPAEHEDEFDQK